ncbi:MAG: hypothetical protein ACLVKO_09405 [Dysgonomonas sp.]
MGNNQGDLEYDEDKAVEFIRNYLPQELKDKFSNDDINYIIDVIYDFYEEKGFLDDSVSDEDMIELDEDEITEYVVKNAKKDNIGVFSREDVSFVIQGEMGYCESIGMFD